MDTRQSYAIEAQNKVRRMLSEVNIEQIQEPTKMIGLIETGARFYQYSLNNIKLIYAQNPEHHIYSLLRHGRNREHLC